MMQHKFVKLIPQNLIQGEIYISIEYKTVTHLCICGCGEEVVTPITPTDWKLIFNGSSISLYPSIGNWDFKCKSHYWIKENKVVWAKNWDKKQIDLVKKQDVFNKQKYYKSKPFLIKNDKNIKETLFIKIWKFFFK